MSAVPVNFPLFLLLVGLIAFLYAGVGHGGASGYLALMALFSFTPKVMKPTALLLNLFVAGVASYHYYRAGYFNKKIFLYFVVTSVPMAFLGGTLAINQVFYKKILGVLLLVALLKMLGIIGKKENHDAIKKVIAWQAMTAGAAIGFFSGLIGIGGGIILSPLILLLHWGKIKETAAVSAVFIWVNSAAGLAGQWVRGVHFGTQVMTMVVVATAGAFMGSYYGSYRVNNRHLRYVLSVVLLAAAVKLVFM